MPGKSRIFEISTYAGILWLRYIKMEEHKLTVGIEPTGEYKKAKQKYLDHTGIFDNFHQ